MIFSRIERELVRPLQPECIMGKWAPNGTRNGTENTILKKYQIRNPMLLLVAGEGFEPSTFGL